MCCSGRKHVGDFMPLVINALFLALFPPWGKQKQNTTQFCPSMMAGTYTPRNTEKGACKCCLVAIALFS